MSAKRASRRVPRPYPFAPVDEVLRKRHRELCLPDDDPRYPGMLSNSRAARLLGVDYDVVSRSRADGLTLWMADRVAVALGYNAGDLWPTWGTEHPETLFDDFDDLQPSGRVTYYDRTHSAA